MWTQEITLQLIERIKCFPEIWDIFDPNYKNRVARKNAYKMLAVEFGFNEVEVEKKIQGLKNQFRREYRNIQAAENCGSPYLRANEWFGYKPMMFLLKAYTPRDKRSDLHFKKEDDVSIDYNNRGEDAGDERLDQDDVEGTEDGMKSPFNFVMSTFDRASGSQPVIKARRMESLNKSEKIRDEFTIYGEYVAAYLRKYTDPYAILVAQKLINNILFDGITGRFTKPNMMEQDMSQEDTTSCMPPVPQPSCILEDSNEEAQPVTTGTGPQ